MESYEIKPLRIKLKLTLQEFADCAGVHCRTVQKWEAGTIKTIRVKHERNIGRIREGEQKPMAG